MNWNSFHEWEIGGRKYCAQVLDAMDYDPGRNKCAELNARLPAPKSIEEAEFLDSTYTFTKWLDLSDPVRESIFISFYSM